MKIWYSYIYQPYAEIIDSGDLEFFINKDYSEDLSYLPNSKDILKSIEGLRDQIKYKLVRILSFVEDILSILVMP